MLIPTFKKYRKRPPRTRGTSSAAPPGLTLVSAAYDGGDSSVILTFDRAVDISAFDGSAISLVSGTTLFGGTTAALDGDAIVEITLVPIGSASGPLRLSATASSGIVAVDDGGTWAGCSDMGLPFP